MSRLFKASVTENRPVIKDHFLLTLHPSEKIEKPKPGNFFMLSVSDCLDPLLKRPFSVHRWLGRDFQILYRVAGKGTNVLSKREPGDIIEIIGPLGNNFPALSTQSKSILVAGGLGIAPIFGLAETIAKHNPLLFYGARTGGELLCMDELKALGIEPAISTDDGSVGEKGNIVDALREFVTRHSSLVTHSRLYACGPAPMLKALSHLAKEHNLRGYIALEQNMACGLGTCLGCVVNTKDGYKRVCKEGPVFPVNEIIWE